MSSKGGDVPVSYTHLDVYKRQVVDSFDPDNPQVCMNFYILIIKSSDDRQKKTFIFEN